MTSLCFTHQIRCIEDRATSCMLIVLFRLVWQLPSFYKKVSFFNDFQNQAILKYFLKYDPGSPKCQLFCLLY